MPASCPPVSSPCTATQSLAFVPCVFQDLGCSCGSPRARTSQVHNRAHLLTGGAPGLAEHEPPRPVLRLQPLGWGDYYHLFFSFLFVFCNFYFFYLFIFIYIFFIITILSAELNKRHRSKGLIKCKRHRHFSMICSELWGPGNG